MTTSWAWKVTPPPPRRRGIAMAINWSWHHQQANHQPCHWLLLMVADVFVSFSGNLYLVFELLDYDLKHSLDAHRDTGLPLPVVRA